MTQAKRTRTRTPESRFNYGAYLASRDWALLKRIVRERSGGVCENCHQRPYEETHHTTYERMGHELPEDLMAVCRLCHEYFSGLRDLNPVNLCCTPEQAWEWFQLLEDEPPEIVAAAERHWREVLDAYQ